MIEFKNVSFFRKDGKVILDNISFIIKKNEYTVITGKNGIGKTTVIKLIAGLLKKNRGEIIIDNEKLEYDSESLYKIRKKMGVVFHTVEEQLIGETVLDSLIFGMENNNIPSKEMEKNIQKYTNYFHIEDLPDRKISTLSGGEKQKVALISSIVTEPKILILDEAMENLDGNFKKLLKKFFQEFLEKGNTIISVSHEAEEIKKSDNIIFLEGNDIKTGNFEKLSDRYKNLSNKSEKSKNSQLTDLLNAKKIFKKIKIYLNNVSYFHERSKKNVINNMTVSIPEGEITAITGKTGIGKTTLIELIYGLLGFDKRFSGEITFYFKESDVNSQINSGITIKNEMNYREIEKYMDKVRKKMSIVFQNMDKQFFESTVEKEIEYNIIKKYRLHKNNPEIKERMYKAMKKAGLSEEYLKKSPFSLSDGEKRLVGIAMALSTEPEILFLDEPTASLDYETSEKIMKLMENLKKENVTVILITHDWDIINSYADNYMEL